MPSSKGTIAWCLALFVSSAFAAEHGAPAVSPDGRHVLFVGTEDGRSELYVISGDGRRVRQLTRGDGEIGIADWSGDGKRILFSLVAGASSRLWSMDVDGHDRRLLATVPGRAPRLSPDGARLLHLEGSWTEVKLIVSNRDGGNARQLTDGTSVVWGPRWSPDGASIAFTGRDGAGQLHIRLIGADGGVPRQLTHLSMEEGQAQAPSWSRDGRRLAVQVSRGQRGTDSSQIAVVDAVTGAVRMLAPHDRQYLDETPSWFPDGRRIAFQSNRTGRMEVWVMNADGTGAVQLTR